MPSVKDPKRFSNNGTVSSTSINLVLSSTMGVSAKQQNAIIGEVWNSICMGQSKSSKGANQTLAIDVASIPSCIHQPWSIIIYISL